MTATKSATAARTGSDSIARQRIKERDAARRDWQVQLEDGETFEDACAPTFLGHKADAMAQNDRVVIVGPEMSFWAELLVLECDEALSAVRTCVLLGPIDLRDRVADAAAFDTSGVQIEEVGAGSFRLRRGAKVISSGFKTRKQAEERLAEIKAGRQASRPGEERR